jgi:copper(I)-binding protein
MNILAGVLLAAVSLAGPGLGGTDITAHHGTVVQTGKAGVATEGFFEIDNAGAADTLTSVTCAIADTTVLAGADGKPLGSLAVPAGQDVKLTAQGPHLLLQATHFAVQPGGILPCSLTFTTAGTISVFLYAIAAPGT